MALLVKNNKHKKPLIIILILFLIFLIPFQLAKRFYLHDIHLFSKASTQHGYLIRPPLNFSQLSLYDMNHHIYSSKNLKGKWILLYTGPSTCSALCKKNLYQLQQIHIATGKDQSRVLRVRLSFEMNNQIFPAPDLLNLMVDKQQFSDFINNLPTKTLALSIGAIYLVDPLGNVMLTYTLEANPSGILKDLKHLLGVSQIG